MKLDRLISGRQKKPLADHPIPLVELCQRYENVFTAAVNDALRENELLHQTLPHDILPLREEMKVAGPAFTVKGARSLEIRDEMTERVRMLEAIPAHSVIVWDTDEDEESAQWGEGLSPAEVVRRGGYF